PRVASSDLGEGGDAMTLAGQVFFSESVFRVGLLPRWISSQGRSHNIGGLAIGVQEQRKVRTRCLKMINTDRMEWRVTDLSTSNEQAGSLDAPASDAQHYID